MCLFTDSLTPSGVGEHMLTLAAGLSDLDLSLVCPPTDPGRSLLERAARLGVSALPLEVRNGAQAERLTRWLADRDVEVFHCHACVSVEGHPGLRAASAAGVPAIVRTEHVAEMGAVFPLGQLRHLVSSPYHRPGQPLTTEELARAVAAEHEDYLRKVACVDRFICVSRGVRNSFVRAGQDPRRITVVRNGIRPRPARSSASTTRERLGIAARRRVVLTVGRFVDVKGYPQLLGAAAEVARANPDVLFIWIGSGPLEATLRSDVRSAGLDDVVLFAPERVDVADVLLVAELFVLPSLVEGLPLVVLEAMAAERPVVATRACGTDETVLDGVTGRLVPAGALDGTGDTCALAGAIVDILSDPQLASSYGTAGRLRVEQEFTAERMARQTAQVYEEVLARHATVGRRQ